MKPWGTLQLTVITMLIYLANAFDDFEEIPPSERLALRNYILNNFFDGLGDGPETRMEEIEPDTKPAIPPNTFVSGGTGEGKQNLGSQGNIPNKHIAIPEIPTEYETPPNPCPRGASLDETNHIPSKQHPGMKCACTDGWEKDEEECTKAPKCCLLNMPNNAQFVQLYQYQSREIQVPHKARENKYHAGVKRTDHTAKKSPNLINKRSAQYVYKKRTNPYLLDKDRINTIVAKKAPVYMNSMPAM